MCDVHDVGDGLKARSKLAAIAQALQAQDVQAAIAEAKRAEDEKLIAYNWPTVASIEDLAKLADVCGLSLTERNQATHGDVLERALNVAEGRRIEELQRARFRAEAERSIRDAEPSECQHSADFRTVSWYGTEYTFTPTQAACVRILWVAWERGDVGLGQSLILEAADSCGQRLDDVFRTAKLRHPAWGVMIVRIRRGVFGLAKPKS